MSPGERRYRKHKRRHEYEQQRRNEHSESDHSSTKRKDETTRFNNKTESATRAARKEQVILQRETRPNATTLPKILKNDKLFKWDGPLLIAASQILFQHQISHF